MGRGWRIGRVAGVDVHVDPSLLVIAALVVFDRWASFSDRARFPQLSSAGAVGLGVLEAALFFGSIFGHELAHAGMSKLRGIGVARITLFMFGGATQTKTEPQRPSDEFLITVVGPLASLALGGVFLLAWPLVDPA